MLNGMSRRYDSTVRAAAAQETRARLVAAAHDLFTSQGWMTTTMTQVAAAAGLARPTVYLHFATKLDLLTACIDAALSDVPVRDRPDYAAMGTGTMPQRVGAAAAWLAQAYQRSAPIQRVLDDAGVTTPEAARVRARMEARRHDEIGNACSLVLGAAPPEELVDEVWALGSRAMWFTFAEAGWSPQDWEHWYVRVLLDTIHAHPATR